MSAAPSRQVARAVRDPALPGADVGADPRLHAPAVPAPPRGGAAGWPYLLVSLFVAYHAAVLLVHNLPDRGPTAPLHGVFARRLDMAGYLQITSGAQNWALFAPEPPRRNTFVQVLVEDVDGRTVDLGHDIHGRRTHPYLFYDRMGKVNRRLAALPAYRQPYGAWICREWERAHGGRRALAAILVHRWTRIPPPREAYATMGFDPRTLPLEQAQPDRVECAVTPGAQLTPALLARLGLPPAPPGSVVPVETRSWWDRRRPGAAPGEGPEPGDEVSIE